MSPADPHDRAITAENATRQARQLALLRDFASRIGQRVGVAYAPTDDGEVYTPDNLSSAAWTVGYHAQLVDAFLQRCDRCGGHGQILAPFNDVDDCPDCHMGYVVKPDDTPVAQRGGPPLSHENGPYLLNIPKVGNLASHEWSAQRYRTAAQQIRGGQRGAWGSNMRAALATLLTNAADALEKNQ